MNKTLAIIPAAGFGTRMNMSPIDAKELLIDPVNNRPVIDWTLELCKNNKIKTVVITRNQKDTFINYIVDKSDSLFILDKVEGEWPDTILKIEIMWENHNIVLLPDTRFSPCNRTIYNIKNGLESGYDLVIAYHKVNDLSKWGALNNNYLEEKPQHLSGLAGDAWGVIGFNKNIGNNLFTAMSQKIPFQLPENTLLLELDWFKDITRTGTLEKY